MIQLLLAGVLGTLARYGLVRLCARVLGTQGFPWGTLAVNALGCLAFGYLWEWSEDRTAVSETTRVAILVGFLGAFTTFSSFAFETFQLMRTGHPGLAAANVVVQNVSGLLLAWLGVAIARG